MNRSRTMVVPLGLLTICAAFIFTDGVSAQSVTAAPQPSPGLQSLTKALSGDWSLSVKFEPTPSAPSGLSNTGEETWRSGPGGFTFIEEEHLRMSEGNLFLLGVIWWNSADKSFHGMECQNLLPYTCDV